ncbi:hypothetical protein D3C87_2129260 [compost metagenome]
MLAEPALIVPTLMTPMPLVMSIRRLIRVCRPPMMFSPAIIGSTPLHGAEPWVCWPLRVMRKASLLLSTVPDL